MVLSKLDLTLVALLAVAALGLEHEHRVVIGRTAADAAPAATAGPLCPDNDDAPSTAECVRFIGMSPASGAHPRAANLFAASSVADRAAVPPTPPCPPSNENEPYSARCLRFLSGEAWHP